MKYLILFILSNFTLSSCTDPVLEFRYEDASETGKISLYADSTFTMYVEFERGSSRHSGTWTADFDEDSVFTTTTTEVDYMPITAVPRQSYRVIEGELTKIFPEEDTSSDRSYWTRPDSLLSITYFSLDSTTASIHYHGQCNYTYPIEYTVPNSFHLYWEGDPDCVFDAKLDSSFGLPDYPRPGDLFASYEIAGDTMRVSYRYPEWVRLYNEKVGTGVFSEVYVRVGGELSRVCYFHKGFFELIIIPSFN